MVKRILSGVQATGDLHLGNYLGAISNWVKMQDSPQNDCFFFLADLHAITVPQEPENLRNSIISSMAAYLACGLDHKKSTIFAQSNVPAHSELAWLLNCITPIGWLNRMTQFKDKAGKNKEKASLGLYSYPVLMAADILLYNADMVPVGEDQTQHIELARDIAGALNRKFDKEVLRMPEAVITKAGKRIMSLKDGTKKMSKSDPSADSRILLSDSPDDIMRKCKKAKTDSEAEISYDIENRPDISNLLSIFAEMTNRPIEEIANEYQYAGYARFKQDLAEATIAKLSPICARYKEYLANEDHMRQALQAGAEKANKVAEAKVKEIKELFGYIS